MRTLTVACLALAALGAVPQDKKKPKIALPPDSLYLLKCKDLEGKEVDLKDLAGQVALVVNLASR
jgi:cytochrome oxidase Cu insertion factor (SCO1/SenC/PrrC family)